MKKMTKRFVTLLMVALLISAFALPVMAATREEEHMAVGETESLPFSETPYESSDTSVVEIEHDGGHRYTARAVGKGTAVITGGSWMGAKQTEYEIVVHKNKIGAGLGSMSEVGGGVFIVFLMATLILLVAEMVYIFIAAPKCGMSRLWALVPLFSHIIGLIVFIVVRSNRNTSTAGVNTFTCPTCNAVHPYGTAVCSVCGRKFY